MPIDGGMRNKLVAGMKLVARYKSEQFIAEVVTGEDGKVQFRLADGRAFKSPSAAGSAVMGGVACNGWRFWRLAGDEPAEAAGPTRNGTAASAAGMESATPKALPQCARCGKQFVGPAQLAHHEANADRLCSAQ